MELADVGNRALDAIGVGQIIGSLTDGTRESETLLRIYGQTVRQLLRAAFWAFARKKAPLMLLADASGQTLDPGTGQPFSRIVEEPWTYAYAWPIDGVRARWLPWSQQPAAAAVPIMPNLGHAGGGMRQVPARFLVSSSHQYPILAGEADWDNLPDVSNTEGVGLTGRRVVLTDAPNASLVYTKLTLDPAEWDELFGEATVAVLAARVALPLLIDDDASPELRVKQRAAAMPIRNAQIAIAKEAILQARVANANDSGWPQSIDHTPDWLRARTGGISRGPWLGDGPGVLRYGYEAVSFGDGGSVF